MAAGLPDWRLLLQQRKKAVSYTHLDVYKRQDLAERLRAATLKLLGQNLKEHGEMFESYHPDTGEPMLHPGFLSHNMPVLEMLR